MRGLIAVAGAALALAAPAGAQQAEVTLEEALRLAVQVQPAMVRARGAARTADADVLAATGAFLPNVRASGSANRSGGTQVSSTGQIVTAAPRNAFSGSITADMSLFDGLQRWSNRRAASASRDAAEAGLVFERFQVRHETKRLFYDALAQEELVRVAEAQVRRAEQQHQISVEKLRAGSATRSDSLRSRVELGDARIRLLEARAALATAQANLGRRIGVDGAVRAAPDTALPAFPDTAGLRIPALDGAPQIQRAEADARARRAELSASRSAFWPTLTASVSNGYSGSVAPWTTLDGYLNGWTLRLSVGWTLFNGFSRERQVTSAAVQRDNARAEAADARREVNAQLTQQLAALATAHERIEISRATVAAATEDLRVQQERYRVGAATILDLLTSQASLTEAEVSLVRARFDYVIALAQVEAIVGREL